jgi:DNA replication protein DnaC
MTKTAALEDTTIRQYCTSLRTPTIGTHFEAMAEQAIREKQSHKRYLEVLLSMEVEEREGHAVARRLSQSHLPRMKTLEEFNFDQAPQVAGPRIRELADGSYIGRAEPVVLIGECDPGSFCTSWLHC